MKSALSIVAIFLSLSQGFGQKADSTTVEGSIEDYIWKAHVQSMVDTFYVGATNRAYVFKINDGAEISRLVLKAGPVPVFSDSEMVYEPTPISEKDNSVLFSFPQLGEVDVMPLLAAIVSFDLMEIKKLKKQKPSIIITGADSSCVEGVFPETYEERRGDSLKVCFYQLHEEEVLLLFDQNERFCYKNHTTLNTDEGEFRLTHWFDPADFGFVKFLLALPDGNEWTIELVEVNEG